MKAWTKRILGICSGLLFFADFPALVFLLRHQTQYLTLGYINAASGMSAVAISIAFVAYVEIEFQ